MAKVLLVDDDAVAVDLQKTLLELEGFDICRYSGGDDFINLLFEEQPNAVLMDVYLENHKLNGLALLEQLRKHPEFEHIKIIMSSGLNFQVESMQQGADGFLLKPYMPEELINLLKEVLL